MKTVLILLFVLFGAIIANPVVTVVCNLRKDCCNSEATCWQDITSRVDSIPRQTGGKLQLKYDGIIVNELTFSPAGGGNRFNVRYQTRDEKTGKLIPNKFTTATWQRNEKGWAPETTAA